MPAYRVVVNQHVAEGKAQRAREMRREMTAAERVLWEALRTNRVEGWHFRRQQIIHRFIVDFYCHRAGLVVEVGGPVHDEQPEYDVERDRMLAARGLRVLRLTNDEVMNDLTAALERIRIAIAHGSPEPEP